MKRYRSVRRRRGAPASPGVSLFPFLAVLLCTMGALILLLVIVARHARREAERKALTAAEARTQADEADESIEDLEAARELVRYRIEKLKESRELAEAELADARLGLGHVEDHARRLREQLDHLETVLAELERTGPETGRQRLVLEAELARVRADAAEAERRLAEARQRAGRRKRSYAVVPYRGPNETLRRPVYLECRRDAIVLMPERIEFRGEDFEGPMGPGNPLAATLRAVREYMLTQGGFDPQRQGEPYPLLLVRPGGIGAYYAARMAMKSWASDFGYELIGEDWELRYPPPDPELARQANEALRRARVLQERLAAAAPRHYSSGRRRALTYRAAPTRGGVVPDGFVGDEPARPPREASRSSGDGFSGNGPASSASAGSFSGAPTAEARDGTAGHTADGALPAAPMPPGSRPETDLGPAGTAPRPGEWNPESASPGGGADTCTSATVRSLADVRGHNWGLRHAGRGSMPVARSIRVDCFPDRLAVVPEAALGEPKVIHLSQRTADSVDALVSAVWDVIDRWGIAGNGMYWRPVLSFRVRPDGDQRFRDLEVLLEGSGLGVERE